MKNRSWRPSRRWIAAACSVLVLGVFHAPLLRLAVSPLVAGDAAESADSLFIYSGDGRFDRAADLYRSGQMKRILVLDRRPTRLTRLGIIPSRADECRRQLARRGIPEEAIAIMPGDAGTPWQNARSLGVWLKDHPDARVQVLCDRFVSRDLRYMMSRVLGASEFERVGLLTLADRRYDETNWWQSRTGWRAAAGAACELAYDRLHGEDLEPGPDFDLEAFERELR